jgi:hypothetical protein
MEMVIPLAVFFVLACCAHAQAPDRFELFGGYSYTRYAVYNLYSGPWTSYSFNGWEASASAKIVPHVELETDFAGGHSGSPQPSSGFNLRTYMGGIRYSAQGAKARFYVHGLLGGLYFANNYETPSSTSFAFALGGGAEYWFQRHFGARLCQIDYLYNTNSAAAQTAPPSQSKSARGHFRLSTGVVFRFGH